MAAKLLLIAVLSYLIGSFPTAYILVKWKSRKNITREGTGNVGTLNALRTTHSKSLAVLVLLGDLLKGALTVYLAKIIFSPELGVLLTASLFVVLGHDFSIWLKLKGGRGLATGAGVFLMIQPWVVVSWLVLWFVIYGVTRKVAYANAFATLLTPGVLLVRAFHLYEPATFIIVFAVGMIIFIKHIPRLVHAMRGEEKVTEFQ